MQILRFLLLVVALAAFGLSQDKVTLGNGDVLTGQVKSMADGKLVLASAILGDVTIPMASVTDIVTAQPVELQTQQGERLKRRIAGVQDGKLKLEGEGPTVAPLALASLDQINPPQKSPETWTGSLTVGANLSAGNTERRAIGTALDAVRRGEDDRINFDASWDYAQDRKRDAVTGQESWDLTQRRTGAGLKYDRFLSKHFYWLVNSRVLGDTLADISLRYTAGAGIGYQLFETDTTNLAFETGLSYFNENYISAAPGVDYLAARVAYKLSYKLTDTTKVLNGVEAFPSLEDANDVYFQMDTKLQTNLTKSMIAQVGWVWDFDNTPAPGRDRGDHRVLLSVGWTF